MEEKPRTDGPPLTRLTFTHDSQSRRVRKVVESFSSSSGNDTLATDLPFLYDD